MKKILAIAIVAVMTLALCVGVNAASLKNHSFDTIYVNDLETPVINNGQAKAWSEENPIDEEITALRVRGWAHVVIKLMKERPYSIPRSSSTDPTYRAHSA